MAARSTSPVNILISFLWCDAETEQIDYEQLAELAREVKPKIIVSEPVLIRGLLILRKSPQFVKKLGL